MIYVCSLRTTVPSHQGKHQVLVYRGRTSSVARALDCRVEDQGLDLLDRANT